MEERVIVDSRFSAVINAALERIDISVRCVSLPDQEYQECSPTHFAAGSATARDGRRVPICIRPQIWLDGAKPLPVPNELQERCSSTGVTDVDR